MARKSDLYVIKGDLWREKAVYTSLKAIYVDENCFADILRDILRDIMSRDEQALVVFVMSSSVNHR